MGKVKEHVGKKYKMINDYVLDNVFDKINETKGIEKLDNLKILSDVDDLLPDQITLKNDMCC